jgi:hypothetical protein
MKRILLCLASMIIGIAMIWNCDYSRFRIMELTVLQAYESRGRYSSNPVLVMKTEQGEIFDLNTSYSTMSQHPPGSKVKFSLRPMDVHQTAGKNLAFVFLPIILISMGFAGLAVSGLFKLFEVKP